MKRAPWYVLAGALAGFLGVIGLNARPAGSTALRAAGQGSSAQPGSSPQPASPAQPASSSSPAGSNAPAAAGPPRSATGKLVPYGYGELAVKVIARGSRIITVSVPTLRTAEPQSQQIAVQVIPMLRSEVLSAGSANISAVSGATYTSDAYAASLQSALDKLHLK